MKLYLKQKAFSWKDSFTVKDEDGKDKYYIVGRIASLGRKLTVTDRLGMDLLSYMIYGARTSVILCVCCTILSTLL